MKEGAEMSIYRTNVRFGVSLQNRAKSVSSLNTRYLLNDLNKYLYSDLSVNTPYYGHVGVVEAFDGTNLWISEGNYTLSNGDYGYIHIYRTTFQAFKAMYPDVVFAVPNGSVLESSLLSDLSLYSMNSGMNITSISADDSKVNVKKLKYKNTKRKNTIYYENGEKIQQYKFKPADEKVVSEV